MTFWLIKFRSIHIWELWWSCTCGLVIAISNWYKVLTISWRAYYCLMLKKFNHTTQNKVKKVSKTIHQKLVYHRHVKVYWNTSLKRTTISREVYKIFREVFQKYNQSEVVLIRRVASKKLKKIIFLLFLTIYDHQ